METDKQIPNSLRVLLGPDRKPSDEETAAYMVGYLAALQTLEKRD